MEDSLSSTNNNIIKTSLSDIELQSSYSEESSWSLYFEKSEPSNDVEKTVTSTSSRISSIYSGISFSVKNINANDNHLASAKSVAKRRKLGETDIDDDLVDTATSRFCNSEAQELEQSPPLRCGKDNLGSFFQEKENNSRQTGGVLHSGFIGEDINYGGLRGKGLCLVPVSLLFQVWETKYHQTCS